MGDTMTPTYLRDDDTTTCCNTHTSVFTDNGVQYCKKCFGEVIDFANGQRDAHPLAWADRVAAINTAISNQHPGAVRATGELRNLSALLIEGYSAAAYDSLQRAERAVGLT